MTRGRRKKENSNTKVISIRITEKQYEVLKKNDWIKQQVIKQVRDYLDLYCM